jgi:apolipoprotein N-acyltransferase
MKGAMGESLLFVLSGFFLGLFFIPDKISPMLLPMLPFLFVPLFLTNFFLSPEPSPFSNGARIRSSGRSFFLGWIFGVTEALTSLWWVVQTIHHFGHLPFILSFFSLFVLSSYLGLFTGLFLFGLDIWKKNDLNNPSNPVVLALFGACLWTILEVLRSELFTGFPLNPLGDLIWGQELLTPDLSILGATGMSFAIIFISGLLSAVILPIINKLSGKTSADLFRKQSLPAIAMSVLTLSAGFGSAELLSKESSAQETQHIKVGIIQGNIPQDQKWTSQYLKDTIRTYHQLSKQALSQDAKILLWPETAIPVVIDSPPRSIAKDLQKALNLPVPIVTGTIGLHREADRFRYSFSNDAALISNNGEILDRYTKIHLVPFGEYIPFPSIFGWLRNMTGITGDLIPGKHQKLFAPFKEEDSRSLPEFYKKIRIGPVICYEAMYPSLVHQLVLKGANLLVVFTDDAWYGKTAASHQLYQQTMIRAIEEGIPLLRAANSGYSGAISGRGKLIRTSGRFTKESITLTVPLDSHETFYQKYGEWVFRFSLVIFLFLLATRAMEPHNDGIKSSPLLDDMH